MKAMNELLAELEQYLEEEIKRCDLGVSQGDTWEDWVEYLIRKDAYQDVLSWVDDYVRKHL